MKCFRFDSPFWIANELVSSLSVV